MSTTRLPELPAMPADRYHETGDIRDVNWVLARDVRELLHAYGLAVWKEAKEAAAQMCEAQEGDATVKAIGKGCAAAIRSLPDPSVIQQGEQG